MRVDDQSEMDAVTRDDPRPDLGLRQVINVAGTMTALGASAAVPGLGAKKDGNEERALRRLARQG